MGLEGSFLKIYSLGIETNTSYLDFGASGAIDSYMGTYTCYTKYNGEITKLYVEVWK